MKKVNDSFDKYFTAKEDLYDRSLTGATWYHRLYNEIFWGSKDTYEEINALLSLLPNPLEGKLLDVPAGSGVFSCSLFEQSTNCDITLLDYSQGMLNRYRQRAGNPPHIHFLQGDVGDLPFDGETFHIITSMNGFHCFPQKEKALSEMARVLKKGGHLYLLTYIKGQLKRSDFLVHRIYNSKGFFMEPHYTKEELIHLLERYFTLEHTEIHGAFFVGKLEKP